MSITGAALISPVGEFSIAMFPEDMDDSATFSARMEAYADAGEAAAVAAGLSGSGADRAALWWAYYRGATDIYNRLLTTPASVDLQANQGQASFLAEQMKRWGDRVGYYLEQFNAEVSLATGQEVDDSRFPPTGHVAHRVDWVSNR
jgi:hypothetical protein